MSAEIYLRRDKRSNLSMNSDDPAIVGLLTTFDLHFWISTNVPYRRHLLENSGILTQINRIENGQIKAKRNVKKEKLVKNCLDGISVILIYFIY